NNFFFNDTATTEIYTLSLHDALPIYIQPGLALSSGEGGFGPFPKHSGSQQPSVSELTADFPANSPYGSVAGRKAPGASERLRPPTRKVWQPNPPTGGDTAAA
ncbi:MAG TPA: hypothetical protein DEA73_09610, partial [Peptococcaceae bacterium]|nr:hypothetical protein [Peptococcaceae bacterium]